MKNELEVVERLKSKCPIAMGELYGAYFDKVYQRCLYLTSNESDAYDCANDAFLISFEKINSFKGGSSYATWLFAIAANYTRSYINKKRKTSSTEDRMVNLFFWPEEFEVQPIQDVTEVMNRILDAIPSEDKELLIQKYSNRKSIQELQIEFCLSASAIKMRLLRAKKRVNDLYSLEFALSA
ncbi:MAG: RNA polymerase sigma factor [Crocinitomicaceae bacterium]